MIQDDRDLELIRGWAHHVAPPTAAVKSRARELVLESLRRSRGSGDVSSKRRRLPRRRVLLVAAILGLLVIGGVGAFASDRLWLPGAVEPGNGVVSPREFEETRRLAGPELARALDIARFDWRERQVRGETEAELILGPHDDRRLRDCGSSKLEGAMLVLAHHEVAYCILGVDTSNPDSEFAARAIASRLISEKPFTNAELEKLKQRVAGAGVNPDGPEAPS